MATLQELEAQMVAVRAELARIDEIANPTDEDFSYQGTLISEHDQLEAEAAPIRKRMADLQRVRSAATQPENREEAVPAKREAPTMFVRTQSDPLSDMDRVRSNLVTPSELRGRALDLIEQDSKRHNFADMDTALGTRVSAQDKAEIASARAEGDLSGKIAQHILVTGSQEYRDAFRSYLQTGRRGEALLETEDYMRAINLTSTSGGFLLPYILDPTIVLTNNASANPFRRISRIVQTTSNAWQGVNSAGVTAAWIAEATTAADDSPTVGQIQIIPTKAAAWVLGSYEALDDTNFGQQLPGLLSDARDRLESAAFTSGAGSGGSPPTPFGVMTSLGTASRVAPTTTGTAFNGTGAIPDVYNLQAALPPRFRRAPGAAWLGNIVTLNKVRALDQYGGGAFWANLTSDTPASLLGQAIYEGSDMNNVTTGTSAASGTGNATLLYGDFGQFIIADRVGVSMLYEPMVKSGSSPQLPIGQAGWYMFWRTGSAVSTTAAFRYLTVS